MKRTIGAATAIGMLILILDGKTALMGAKTGVELCLWTIIPSLFPFFVLSILLTNRVLNSHRQTKWESNTTQKSQQPAKTLFIAGLLGGYPTGAQAVMEAFRNGSLPEKTAHRLLGFCSNAGPAFIFGITGRLFSARCSGVTSGMLFPSTGGIMSISTE